MEILDEDIEFVRKALADASEAAKGWFETLVEQHAERGAAKEELTEKNATLADQVETLTTERDEYKEAAEHHDEDLIAERDEAHETLTTVRYWLHDVLLLGKAPSSPRRLLQLVERALGHG